MSETTSKEQLQARYDALEKEKEQYKDDSFRLKQIEVEQQDIQALLRDMEQAATKAAVISMIPLPQDYDALTNFPGLNAEIDNLISQALDQMQALHAEELENVHSTHKAALEQLQTAISELTERNTQLQQVYDAEQAAHTVTKTKLFDEQEARADVEKKRDNAVALAEQASLLEAENKSLKGQVDELEGMVRTLKKPAVSSGGLTLTSTLKAETEEERKARLDRQRMETINRNLGKYDVPPIRLPQLNPPVTEKQLEDAFQSVQGSEAVARGDAGGDGVSEAAAAVDGAADAPAGPALTKQEFEIRLQQVKHEIKAELAMEYGLTRVSA